MIGRRRFLTITAGALIAGPAASATRWQGRAMGAYAEIDLRGDKRIARHALTSARAVLQQVEDEFSIYRQHSRISRLNRAGVVPLSQMFADLLRRISGLHEATGGRFDPTVGADWAAWSKGQTIATDRRWSDVRISADSVALYPGMALTFNGIAQGYATDAVARVLRSFGFRDVVVNIGEYWAGTGSARIAAPHLGRVLSLREQAVATSDRLATRFTNGRSHIIDPAAGRDRGFYRYATVVADDAATADGLSTALCLTGTPELARRLLDQGLARQISLVAPDGSTVSI